MLDQAIYCDAIFNQSFPFQKWLRFYLNLITKKDFSQYCNNMQIYLYVSSLLFFINRKLSMVKKWISICIRNILQKAMGPWSEISHSLRDTKVKDRKNSLLFVFATSIIINSLLSWIVELIIQLAIVSYFGYNKN